MAVEMLSVDQVVVTATTISRVRSLPVVANADRAGEHCRLTGLPLGTGRGPTSELQSALCAPQSPHGPPETGRQRCEHGNRCRCATR